MGCGSSKKPPDSDFHIEPIDVPDTEDGYPPPKPPKTPRNKVYKEEDCASLDENAKSAAATLSISYQTLLDYLTKDARNDVQKVRAIYTWLGAQPILSGMKFSRNEVKDAHSPKGYMKTIQQGDGNYTAFFALLCRAAKIPCVIIYGSGKAAEYEVGDKDLADLNSRWNAVHVDGSWRLVHVYWSFVGLQGFNKGGWTKVEEDGKAVRQKEKAASGTTVQTCDDFWFLTDPDEFIYSCRAKNEAWQLLKKSWSKQKFLSVPHFSTMYFTSGFTLTSKHAAILISEKGICDITFKHQPKLDADLTNYTLLFDEQNSEEQLPQSLQLDKYVIQLGSPKEKSLRVRFPVRGIYKIKISGKGEFQAHLVDFRLQCDNVLKNVEAYPINPEIGFGYSKVAEDAGLEKPSQVKGIIVVQQGEVVKFQFRCKTKLELQTLLLHKDLAAADLADYVKEDRSGNNVTITVTVPEHAQNPEYALQLNSRPEGSDAAFTNVVNYLLTHGRSEMEGEESKEETVGDSQEGDDLRKELKAATDSGDIKRLEKAIIDFEKAGLPDNGDLTEAKRVLRSLHKKALQRAIENRNLEELEAALNAANESVVSSRIRMTPTYKEAEELRGVLRRLKLYMHKILELKPMTVSEIHSYNRARPLVHTVMKATYILLGEREKQLQQWEYIQALLRRQGKHGIIRRIKEFDVIHLKPRKVDRAETHLSSCTKDQVRLTSAGAGTFFVWSSNIIKEGRRSKDKKDSKGNETSRDIEDDKGNETSRDIEEDKGKETSRDTEEDKGNETSRDIEEDKGNETSRDIEEDKGNETSRDIEEDKGKETSRDTEDNKGNETNRDIEDNKGKETNTDTEDKGNETSRDIDDDKGNKSNGNNKDKKDNEDIKRT